MFYTTLYNALHQNFYTSWEFFTLATLVTLVTFSISVGMSVGVSVGVSVGLSVGVAVGVAVSVEVPKALLWGFTSGSRRR